MTFSNLVPDPLPPDSAYIPRVFGFRVHQSARQKSAGSSPTQMIRSEPGRNGGDAARGESVGKPPEDEQNNDDEGKAAAASAAAVSQDTNDRNSKPSSTKGKSNPRIADDSKADAAAEDDRPKRKADTGRKGGAVDADNNGVIENTAKRRKRPDST
mmetsp:Transcript_34042/g.78491  ORF Transcript_34042/g.78491 Transcript_34042/m.78491 type:complete len:156 (+) Transcript_34042:1090-1557(+)